jgi:hypothetical protein
MRRRRFPVGKLFRTAGRDRLLLVEAAGWLLAARLALIFVPFRRLAARLGRAMAESPASDPRQDDLARRVGWAVGVASRYTPWKTRCFAEAIAAKAMLRRRGVPSTLYLGVNKAAEGEIAAHAWLRCGSRVLTGERALDDFTVIAQFAEEQS